MKKNISFVDSIPSGKCDFFYIKCMSGVFVFRWEMNFRGSSIYTPDCQVKEILTVNSPVTASKPT